ncbi:MAG: hypothetical protein M3478_02485, partial [Planctomycetota bacterium]|nr:hypothetical protein [Planctomycetota bacterium]
RMASTPSPLSPDFVRAQLERVLAADTFANAGRISRLLRYVVDRTLAGEADQLKEYVVGTEVFDRGDAYDPRLDSIVRVEARRLRAKLEDYYQGPGKDDPLVITVPRGSYVPAFALRPDSSATVVEPSFVPPTANASVPPPAPATARSWRFLAMVGFLAAIVTVVVIAGTVSRRTSTRATQASGAPSIAILLFQHYSASADDAILAARLTDGVTTELARLGTVSVVSRASASHYIGEMRPAREIAKALNVDFIMESTLTVEPTRMRVAARLVDGTLDRKVWVGEYDAAPTEIRELSRRIATESAAGALKYKAAH